MVLVQLWLCSAVSGNVEILERERGEGEREGGAVFFCAYLREKKE